MTATAVPKPDIMPDGEEYTAGTLRWLMDEISAHRQLLQHAVEMIRNSPSHTPQLNPAKRGYCYGKNSDHLPPMFATPEDHSYLGTTPCLQHVENDLVHTKSRRRPATEEFCGHPNGNKAASSHKSNTREPRELRPSRSKSRSDCKSTALSVHQPRVPTQTLNSMTLNSELTATAGLQVCPPPQLGKGDHGTGTKSQKPEPATKRVSFTCEPSPCQVVAQGYCKPTPTNAASICTPSPTSTTGAEQPTNKAISRVKVSLSRKPVYCSVKCDSPPIPKVKGDGTVGPALTPETSLPLGLEIKFPVHPPWNYHKISQWPDKITAQDVHSHLMGQCDSSRFTFYEPDGTLATKVPPFPPWFRHGAASLAVSCLGAHTLGCVSIHGVRTSWQAAQLTNLFEGHKWVTYRHRGKDSTGLYDMSFLNTELTRTKDLSWLTRKAVLHSLLPTSHKRRDVPPGPSKYTVEMTYSRSIGATIMYNQLGYYVYTTKKNWLEFGAEVTTPTHWNTKDWIEPVHWTTLPDPLEEEFYPEPNT
eukprot:TRINITY_DN67620_c1_g8_i1.p1 TRINITY_DN67620_c1_g8~~TRINITY_DN67620_c1_g8_i1.p1  ORF type:complete len:551 (+),score=15.45 TRINITY_DN67620_c1_g8_i1:65-1654(+)